MKRRLGVTDGHYKAAVFLPGDIKSLLCSDGKGNFFLCKADLCLADSRIRRCLLRSHCLQIPVFQKDPLHQRLLALRNRERVISLSGQIPVGCKSQRKRTGIFIYGKCEDRKGFLRFSEQFAVVIMQAFHLLIAERQKRSVTALIIGHARDLIQHCAVVQIVKHMHHAVVLSGLGKKLLRPTVGQAPVILCIGHIVQKSKVVGKIPARISVKGIIPQKTLHACGF